MNLDDEIKFTKLKKEEKFKSNDPIQTMVINFIHELVATNRENCRLIEKNFGKKGVYIYSKSVVATLAREVHDAIPEDERAQYRKNLIGFLKLEIPKDSQLKRGN